MLPAVALGAGAILLAGCTQPVDVTAPSPSGDVASQCSALVSAVPHTVADQASREVSPPNGYVAAWGDPPVVLRCGVPAPVALRPSSQCFVVDGVGWLVTQGGHPVDPRKVLTGTVQFTTIGRSAYVEVTVPDDYQPATNALVDLTATIKRHTTQVGACV